MATTEVTMSMGEVVVMKTTEDAGDSDDPSKTQPFIHTRFFLLRASRKMMDSGQLDFYEHGMLCTNTCRSTKFDLLINNTRFPPDGSGLLNTPTSSQGEASQGPAAPVVLDNGGVAAAETEAEDGTETLAGKMDWSSVAEDSSDKRDGGEISEETLNFWKGIADVGLMGEVVSNITTELLGLLNGVQHAGDQTPIQDAEVAVLSNLAQVFGLLDSVKKILERKREQTDPSEEQVLSALTNLEQQLEEQRRLPPVRTLLSSPPAGNIKTPAKRQSAKRPRLQRPTSTTTILASPHGALQPQQFTLLSPMLSSGASGQPFTVTSLAPASSSNTVTLLPPGAQVFTRYVVAGIDGKGTETFTLHPSSGLTLVGTASPGGDGGCQQLSTLLSPMELVQLGQQAGLVGGTTEVLVQQDVIAVEDVEEEEEDEEEEVGEVAAEVEEVVVVGETAGLEQHAVIEINPAPVEQVDGVGVMELQLSEVVGSHHLHHQTQTGAMQELQLSEVVGSHHLHHQTQAGAMQELQLSEVVGSHHLHHQTQTGTLQRLHLDANGQLAGLHIVVIEDSTQGVTKIQ
ncbi:hypothetical protein NHX12_023843 [Muraenolepis orangiensis]|uniref:GMEB1/2/Spe-44-like domain-containing protein n=1 Tax=Muraenolepis orangiensis TaxID=630683 RepID=A0A9Q0EPM0_9TELE|nr:hypothetical protein NHX12_023843 [Muraenolepis orangiensis]